MSVEINWERLTGGPDGAALAETIRQFIHERFQAIPLPKLIRSVKVHGFEFGKTAPEIVIKDICDPLPDFYESEEEDIDDENADAADDKVKAEPELHRPEQHDERPLKNNHLSRNQPDAAHSNPVINSNLSRGAGPGVLGTTSNLGYFHLPLSAGPQTPLAAFAGAHFTAGGGLNSHNTHRHADSFSSVSSPPSATPASPKDHVYYEGRSSSVILDDLDGPPQSDSQQRPDVGPEDMQVVFHVRYAGDVRLSLTADVFLDYPMPSFVGIPLKLRITGITFNGVGIVAYIKRKAHLCFLNPEDAEALVGREVDLHSPTESDGPANKPSGSGRVGALLEDIRIESEMGESDSGRQVLKNVGKIEKFILEQVQRIFEDEFVYPSFWTFLV